MNLFQRFLTPPAFSVFCLALFVATGLQPGYAATPTVMISEFMAANDSQLQDDDGDYSDWIEVFNHGSDAINLKGLALTDDANELRKWVFPDVTVAPGSPLVVFASGKDRSHPRKPLHTNFKLDIKGEYLALVAADGSSVVHEFRPKYPDQKQNVSYGIAANWGPGKPLKDYSDFLVTPTPGQPNAEVLLGDVGSVKLSHKRGFYGKPFELELTTETPDAVIVFTTNGSVPTPGNGSPYEGPLTISKTTVLRVAAFKPGYQSTKVKTHSFFFPEDIVQQSPDGLPPEGFPYLWGKNQVDYGMDPRVVEDPRYSGEIIAGLLSLPSFSLVTDMDNMFGEENGVYSNPGEQGRDWERACSLELINPENEDGFQIDCGFRVRGGFSRLPLNPKHALRLFFRDVYGPSKLEYPLFGENGAQEFDNLDLRTFQNYSWSYQQDPRALFIRDQLSRDLQLAMGQPASRGEFCHLYINGHYWGLYNTCERTEASFGAAYLGGKKSDFDAVKVDSGFTTRRSTYTIIPTDGNTDAWTRLYDKAQAGLESNEDYFALQGRNPDGTPKSDGETLMDVDNLISYMMVIFWGGNLDAPVTKFGGNRGPNNWHGIRNRNGDHGFQFFVWDAEHTLLDVNEDRTGPFNTGATVAYSSPQWLWQQCLENPEFRMRVADHIYEYFFNEGLLTEKALRERIMERAGEIESAVIAESARWGDVKQGFTADPPRREDEHGNLLAGPFTRDDDWRKELNRIVNEYLPKRGDIVLAQLYQQGLIPDVEPPRIARSGSGLTLGSSSPGTIYYTTDGSDPRLVGGKVSPNAKTYEGPVQVGGDSRLKARVFSNGDWSALAKD